MNEELEKKLDFNKIQEQMSIFHKSHGFRLPNILILPAELAAYQTEKISEIFGMKVIYGIVNEPTVGLV